MVGQRATQPDNLFEDCKAQIVEWSWCELACRMERWAATAHEDWQQGKRTSITPIYDNSTLASNRLPYPLLDGGQGKTAPAHQILRTAMQRVGIQTRTTVMGRAGQTTMGREQHVIRQRQYGTRQSTPSTKGIVSTQAIHPSQSTVLASTQVRQHLYQKVQHYPRVSCWQSIRSICQSMVTHPHLSMAYMWQHMVRGWGGAIRVYN
jgi:hypothetical protein